MRVRHLVTCLCHHEMIVKYNSKDEHCIYCMQVMQLQRYETLISMARKIIIATTVQKLACPNIYIIVHFKCSKCHVQMSCFRIKLKFSYLFHISAELKSVGHTLNTDHLSQLESRSTDPTQGVHNPLHIRLCHEWILLHSTKHTVCEHNTHCL